MRGQPWRCCGDVQNTVLFNRDFLAPKGASAATTRRAQEEEEEEEEEEECVVECGAAAASLSGAGAVLRRYDRAGSDACLKIKMAP